MKMRDLSGQRFGRLTVSSPAESGRPGGRPRTVWNCLCDCGQQTIRATDLLVRGAVKSCGCLRAEVSSRREKAKAFRTPDSARTYLREWKRRDRQVNGTPIQSREQRLLHNLRNRLRMAVIGTYKVDRTVGLLGCSIDNLRIYLESLFQPGMTWENYGRGVGKWNVDHILPCALFDLSKPDHQMRCFHFSNLQPMWAIHNAAKRDRLNWVRPVATLALLACMALASCTSNKAVQASAIAPLPVVSTSASFDGNQKNSGIVDADAGGIHVTQGFLGRYDALLLFYGRRLSPPRATGDRDGVVAEDPGSPFYAEGARWVMTGEVVSKRFDPMNQWRKQDQALAPSASPTPKP